MSRHRLILPGLAVLAYGVAFAQRPGKVVADTAVGFYIDPRRLLGDLTSAWSPTGDLGHVAAGQGGHLFPMAPWFALGDALGMPVWVVHRLWLGTLLFVAAWGVVRLMEATWERDRGVPHATAAALFAVNPYVTVSASRASVALLAYAAVPWLLLCVNRGLRDPRGWRWPAAFALVVAATGGGASLAATGWALLGPLLLVAYELRWGGVGARALLSFVLRLAPALVVACAWWIVPLVVRLRYGEDLPPVDWPASLLHVSERTAAAGLALAGLALGGFYWTRRKRYGPFYLLLALVGLVFALEVPRTTYAAAALVALGLAVLAGGALAGAMTLLAARRHRVALAIAAAALAALAAWPLVTGRAPDRRSILDVPAAWRQLAADLDRRPQDARAIVEPAAPAALPSLTRHPVAIPSDRPVSGRRSAELQRTVDDLVARGEALPGQLRPLLNLLAAGDVVLNGRGARAADAATVLAPVLDVPGKDYGSVRLQAPGGDRIGIAHQLPELRRVELTTDGIVRVVPRGPATIVDGGAAAIAALASYGVLQLDRPIRYAADLSPAELRAAARGGATMAMADAALKSERALRGADLGKAPLEYLLDLRPPLARTIVPPAARHWTADARVTADPATADGVLDVIAGTTGPGSAASSSRFANRPGYRASSAFDGDAATAWVAAWRPREPAFLSWTTRRPVSVRRLRIAPPPFVVRVPTVVSLNGRRATVAPDGTIAFDAPVRGTKFRLDVLGAAFPGGTPRRLRQRQAVGIAELDGAGLRLSVPRAGPVRAPCGTAALSVGGKPLAFRATGDVAAFDAGRPLEAHGCDGIDLAASPVDVRGLGRPLAVDHMRLASEPPTGIVLPGQGGRVVRQGHGSRGHRDGVRVQIDGPSWLVLGQSYNRGWRARCNGQDLGAPQPLQGYANGWLVDRGCSRVDFRFGPDNTLRLAYLLSIFGIPFLLVAVVRRRRPGYTNLALLTDPDPVRPLDLLTAAAVGGAGAVAVGAVFTPVAGVIAFPLLAGLLWRGARVRRLIEGATLLLAAGAPAAYVLADWDVARSFVVAGVCLLALALVRTLMAARAP